MFVWTIMTISGLYSWCETDLESRRRGPHLTLLLTDTNLMTQVLNATLQSAQVHIVYISLPRHALGAGFQMYEASQVPLMAHVDRCQRKYNFQNLASLHTSQLYCCIVSSSMLMTAYLVPQCNTGVRGRWSNSLLLLMLTSSWEFQICSHKGFLIFFPH